MSGTEWASTEDGRCVARCFMNDSHWGKVPQQCDRPHGHDGDHMAELRACEPIAYLGWSADTGPTGVVRASNEPLPREHRA